MWTSLMLCVISALPVGGAPAALEQPWFPDALHQYVWTNWGLVPLERMAAVVEASPAQLEEMAERMGLGAAPVVSEDQWRRSYITVIRRNWHLLPYEQLLALLQWSEEEMAYTLREDDFLYIKLGSLKPACAPLKYAPPSESALRRAEEIGGMTRAAFPEGPLARKVPLFDFVRELSSETSAVPLETSGGMSPRYCYSYFALYGDPLLDPLANPYPDAYLARLASLGVNGVWLQGVLFKLAPFPWDAALSERHEERLENLKALVARAKSHGIGVYLYLNEPRTMPNAFFEKHPELRGVTLGDFGTLCTSLPEVREYISGSVELITRTVPELAGFFTISASENPTNCWSHGQGAKCVRCAKVGPGATIAGANAAIQEGINRAKSKATLFAWDWGWGDDWAPTAIAELPKEVSVMSVSEWSIPIVRGGIESSIGEYSLSVIGPGPRASRHWELARQQGHNTVAKIQAGTTWELGGVPYIPAVANIAEHTHRLAQSGVNSLMLGWTLGGYPSPNLEVACALAAERALTPDEAMLRVATRRFGVDNAAAVVAAWRTMSSAFQEFPYNGGTVYNAPLPTGPSNPLWATPTGYASTMVGIPYDDANGWRSVYPADIFAQQLLLVADGFDAALSPLRELHDNTGELAREIGVGEACAIHFRSVAQQTQFVEARNALLATADSAAAAPLLAELERLIAAERSLALRLHAIQSVDPRIGFEATNHYFYVANDLAAKIINCEYLLHTWLPEQRARVDREL
jgi:hypothetical protein